MDTKSGNVHPKVTRLRVAGNFVGFFLAASVPFSAGPVSASGTDTTLYVFDAAHRRVDMRDLAVCASGSTCGFVPLMIAYGLTANGWVAELYENIDATSNIGELVATYAPAAAGNTRQSVPLDFSSTISGLALSGGAANWTGDLSGTASAVLGPSLVPSSAPQALSACQLLTTTDVSRVLGPASSSASATGCDYSSQANPSQTLALSAKTGLSSQQVNSDAKALQGNNSFSQIFGYGYGYSMFLGSVTSSGEQFQFLSANNGSEVSLNLTSPGPNTDQQLPWLANVAFDRLFAVPVQRTN